MRQRQNRWTKAAVVAAFAVVLVACQPTDVNKLASDEMGGRNNQTVGSAKARAYIVDRLRPNAEGANGGAEGEDRYLQSFPTGTNIVAIVPGTDLADEYVMVGAHYDHLGRCPTTVPSDVICNGATDNATGVSAVLNVADELAASPPRRSVIVALWDAEEDGMVGSKYYAAHPLIPLADTVAYVNIDMQGANLLPSLRNTTFAVSSETGGKALEGLVTDAAHRSPLDVGIMSNIFGAGYSDQSSFIAKSVPSVFLTDSAAGCYHTAQDEASTVDWGKLERQRKMLLDLVGKLASGSVTPTYTSKTPLATFEDVRQFKRIVDQSWPDRHLHAPSDQATVASVRLTVTQIFDAGPAKFDSAAVNRFLAAAAQSNQILENDACRGGYVKGR